MTVNERLLTIFTLFCRSARSYTPVFPVYLLIHVRNVFSILILILIGILPLFILITLCLQHRGFIGQFEFSSAILMCLIIV